MWGLWWTLNEDTFPPHKRLVGGRSSKSSRKHSTIGCTRIIDLRPRHYQPEKRLKKNLLRVEPDVSAHFSPKHNDSQTYICIFQDRTHQKDTVLSFGQT